MLSSRVTLIHISEKNEKMSYGSGPNFLGWIIPHKPGMQRLFHSQSMNGLFRGFGSLFIIVHFLNDSLNCCSVQFGFAFSNFNTWNQSCSDWTSRSHSFFGWLGLYKQALHTPVCKLTNLKMCLPWVFYKTHLMFLLLPRAEDTWEAGTTSVDGPNMWATQFGHIQAPGQLHLHF